MDLYEKIMDMYYDGYFCGQMIAALVLESAGGEDPGLVRAMQGLNGGIGFSGGCCGCMTAGVCMLSYFTGKGADGETEKPEHRELLTQFLEWFRAQACEAYGGVECNDITMGNPAQRIEVCPELIAETYTKVMELLGDNGLL